MYLLPEDPYQDMLDFEARAYMGWSEPGNDGIDRTPEKSDLLYDQMEALETPEQREGEEY